LKLTKRDFNLENYSQVANRLDQFGQFVVPKGQVVIIGENSPMRIIPTAKATDSPGAGSSRTELTVSLGFDIVENQDRNLKNAFFAQWNGSKATVNSVDYVNNTVTIAVDDTDATAEVWAPIAKGYIEVKAEAPGGLATTSSRQIYADELLALQAINQKKKGALTPGGREKVVLPEDFRINLYAKTDLALDNDQYNSSFVIHYRQFKVEKFLEELQRKTGQQVTRKQLPEMVVGSWSNY
jgi:hypothetical protein